MFINTKKALDQLDKAELSQEESLRLMGIVNKQFNAFPVEDVITQGLDGGMLANGRKLDIEEVIKFRQGVSAVRDNWAFQLLADQILYLAIQQGIHYGDTTDRMMFSKVSIYFITKFRNLLENFDKNLHN